MTYHADMRYLLERSGCDNDFYDRIKPVLPEGEAKPLTKADRRRDAKYAKDKGYRRFEADYMGEV